MVLPVCLTVVPEAAQVALGGQLAVALTLQNTSDREACYHLDVRGIPVDWYDLDQRRVALLPTASAQILLNVHPRGGTLAAAGCYALTVQVTAEDDPALQAAAAVALTVSTASGVDMDVQPTDGAGRAATFRLTYHNHSPAPVAIALVAHDSEEGVRFRLEPAEPVVVPGDRAGSVVVHVVPQVRQLVGAPQAYGIVFRALPLWTVPESQAELVREARFTYVPYVRLPALVRGPVWIRRLPVWSAALALVLLVLLLVVAGGRTLATATRTAGMRTPAPTGGVQALRPGRPPLVPGHTRGLSRPSIRRPMHTRRARVAPPTTLYFAEGYTGLLHTNGRATFDESLVVQNTTPVTATVTITYLFQWGRPVVVTRRIGPHATQRESVNADIGPDKLAAAVVSSAARLTTERIIRRVGARGLRLGTSSTPGTASLGQTFYFAAGHSSPSVQDQEYLAVANPGRAAAHVRVTLARVVRAGAATARGPSGTFTVPAHRRATWHIGRNMWSLATTSGSLIVRSDQPIAVERVSYVGNGDGSAKYGATVSAHKS